jgi:hypothetical protein
MAARKLSDWHQTIDVEAIAGKVGKRLPLVGNIISGIFQGIACYQVHADMAKQSKPVEPKNIARLLGTVSGFCGTLCEITLRMIGKTVETTAKAARAAGKFSEYALRLGLRVGAKYLGMAAAGVGAFLDASDSWDAFKQGNVALGVTLAVSAIAGFGLVAAMWAASGIGIIVATVIILVATVVSMLLPNAIDTWLQKCCWGTAPDKNRNTAEKEMKALEEALS